MCRVGARWRANREPTSEQVGAEVRGAGRESVPAAALPLATPPSLSRECTALRLHRPPRPPLEVERRTSIATRHVDTPHVHVSQSN